MTDVPPQYLGVHVECSLSRPARKAATYVTRGTVLMSAYREGSVLISSYEGCAIGYIRDDYGAEIASWMRRGWFFETVCAENHPCYIHWCHIVVDMRPILPRAHADTSKATRKETVDA